MINNIKDLKTKEEVFEFFREYLKSNIELSQRKIEAEEGFEKPAWSSFQAYHLGSIKSFRKLLALIPDREKYS